MVGPVDVPVKGSLNSASHSSAHPKAKDPVQIVAGKAIKDLPKDPSTKKVNASLWTRLGKCFRRFFSCWSCCFGKKESEKDPSTTQSSSNAPSSSKKTEIPKGDVFEALDWIFPKKSISAPAPIKPFPVKKDWKDLYPDYVARDLKALGFAIEEMRKGPNDLQIKFLDKPLAESNKEYQVKNPIFFKTFPEFDVSIMHQDLFESQAEVIVNAANTGLLGGGGIDGLIHLAGGKVYKREHWNLKRHYDAKFTSGYAAIIKDIKLNSPKLDKAGKTTKEMLTSTKDVIVVAGPLGPSNKIVTEKLSNSLYSCYYNSLVLAHDQGKKSIAFPSISTGIFDFPKGPAAEISLRAIEDFMTAHPDSQLKTIAIHCFTPGSSNAKADRNDLLFYQDAVNCYPEKMSAEAEDGSSSTS